MCLVKQKKNVSVIILCFFALQQMKIFSQMKNIFFFFYTLWDISTSLQSNEILIVLHKHKKKNNNLIN